MFFVKVLLFVWQLPQNLAGMFLYLFSTKKKMKSTDDIPYYKITKILPENTAISMGNFIFVNQKGYVSDNVIRHEHGHQIQSMILGWLYLILVGIPSAIRCSYARKYGKDYTWYHSGYPENWADKLGKVVE